MKVSSLIYKRDFDYEQFTKTISKIVSDKLQAAAKVFLKKNREMNIKQIDIKPQVLPGYAFIQMSIDPHLGDVVQLNNAELVVDEDNISNVMQSANLVISLKSLDSDSALVMYKNLCDVRTILESSKEDYIDKLVQLDGIDISETPELINAVEVEIMENPEFLNILEVLTTPPDVSIMGFDKSKLTGQQVKMLQIRNMMNQETLIS